MSGSAPDLSADTATIITMGRLGSSDTSLDNQHQLVALLAYLAHEGESDRREIATIFWPHAGTPLNSLSSALSRIRRLVPGAVTGDQRRVATTCTTDALSALARLESGDAAALDDYGAFLDGYAIKKIGIELEEWIFDTRDAIAEAFANMAAELSLRARHQGDIPRAIELAERAAEIAPGARGVINSIADLHGLLDAADRPAADLLAASAADHAIELGTHRSPTAVPPPTHDAMGREAEIQQLIQELRPGRIVNLFGIAGVGKSWLARRLAGEPEIIRSYGGLVSFIELPPEPDDERLRADVLAAVGVDDTGESLSEILGAELKQPAIVIIDDVAATATLDRFLDEVGQHDLFTVLLTSRLRLPHPTCIGFSLRGLAVGDGPAGPGPAVDLFLRKASTVPTDAERDSFVEHAITICRFLSGLPLAVELTASWLRVVPIADVLRLLDGELLTEPPPGVDHSILRIVEQSWELLPDEQRAALSGLSIMRGGCSRDAAREVAGVGLRDLADLHDLSLVEIDEVGRVRSHPLVQTYALRTLDDAPDRRDELLGRHRRWFAGRVAALADGEAEPGFVAELDADRDNIDTAWEGLVQARDWQTIAEIIDPIDQYLIRTGQTRRAQRLFDTALDGLTVDRTSGDELHATVISNLAWIEMLLGNHERSVELCRSGLEIVPAESLATSIALIRTRCAVDGNNGDFRTALVGYESARSLADELNDDRLRALLEEDIGRANGRLGNTEAALAAFRSTLDAGRRLDDPHMEARSYLMLAVTMTASDPERSMVLYEEGERVANQHGLRHLAAYFPLDRGNTLLAMGDLASASGEFNRALELGVEVGDQLVRVGAQLGLARAQLQRGDHDAARPNFQEGFRAAIRSGMWPPVLSASADVTRQILNEQPGHPRALAVTHFANEHPHTPIADRSPVSEVSAGDLLDAHLRLDEFCELVLQLLDDLAS